MPRYYVPVLIVLLSAAGCDHAIITPDTTSDELRGSAGAARELPFKARLLGVASVPNDPGRCAPLLTAGNMTHGTMSHLGRVTGEHSQCIDPTGVLQNPLAFSDGRVTFTRANGDQLFVTFAGILSPTETAGVLAVDNPFAITGGTGRFIGAAGGGRATGALDVRVPETPLVLNLDGRLILP